MTVHELPRRRASAPADPARQGFLILHAAMAVLPIVLGLDKFLGFLGGGPPVIAPAVLDAAPLGALTLIKVVGLVEIALGVGVAMSARLGGYALALWFALLALNAAVAGEQMALALRDAGLLFGALALGRGAARWSKV